MTGAANGKRIAVMGGTFDPIHLGHLAAAEAARVRLAADEVLFIPSGRPPHKDNLLITGFEHRYLMCALATAENPSFTVSRIESDRTGATYTVDTIRALRAGLPDETEIFFITGEDALREIFTWKEPEALAGLCEFVSVPRPGYKNETNEPAGSFKPRVTRLDAPAMDISSSDIRARIRSGLTARYLVPDSVLKYIEKNGLYPASDLLAEKINGYIKKELSGKRYIHTLGVAEAASRLARRYGEDPEKTRIAALLHDCAKDFDDEKMRGYLTRYNIEPDVIVKSQINLAHPLVAAEIARDRFGVFDEDILNSLKSHTTGRAGMSKLEKIIYVADCIDESRDYYEGLESIREAAFVSLDKAAEAGLKAAINYTINKGRPVHPLSYEALSFIKNNG